MISLVMKMKQAKTDILKGGEQPHSQADYNRRIKEGSVSYSPVHTTQ